MPKPSGGSQIGRVHQDGIFMKLSPRLTCGERVGLVNARQFCDFRAFQKELPTVGTNNFANGQVATEIRPSEVAQILAKSSDINHRPSIEHMALGTDHRKIADTQIEFS